MNFLRLRKYIGVLGISIPIFILIKSGIQSSISFSYYTTSHDYFVGCLYAIGLFLFCDKGYDIFDTSLNRISGICALLVANFPCNGIYSWIHYLSASILFTTLGIISFFLFTKSNEIKSEMKLVRNDIYKTCGIFIFISVVTIFIFSIKKIEIFIPESICLFSFGFSWLIKGETILKDN